MMDARLIHVEPHSFIKFIWTLLKFVRLASIPSIISLFMPLDFIFLKGL